LSHLEERKEKICLNCNAALHGRYCQVCGQENIEPKESVWHLVNHFFQDVTHFDGKFFSTVKLLLTKPGFLSREYMIGRRVSYLNPIRMYVFTSAIFFLIFFSISTKDQFFHVNAAPPPSSTEKKWSVKDWEEQLQKIQAQLKSGTIKDSSDAEEKIEELTGEIAAAKKIYGDTTTRKFSIKDVALLMVRANMDSLKNAGLPGYAIDSLKHAFARRDTTNDEDYALFGISITQYPTPEAYDSIQQRLPSGKQDGWFSKLLKRKTIEIRNEMRADQKLFFEHFQEKLLHSFPKILFISLPFFALMLKLVYIRRPQFYYTNHGIFAIHLYCATFIILLVVLLFNKLQEIAAWEWVKVTCSVFITLAWLYIFIYLYKAMRNFYKQNRFKTIVKYLIINLLAFIINLLLFVLFVLISVISV
jgi:hypothetical protein